MGTPGFSRLSVLLSAFLPPLALACSAGEPGATGAPELGDGQPKVLTSSSTPEGPTGEVEAPATGEQDDGDGSHDLGEEGSDVPAECSSVGSLAATLALAVANELQRWDALHDFELRSGKLALSATGELRCQASCSNVRALLSLQESAASELPGHDPLALRSQLASWYAQQESALSQLVEQRLVLDKGVYRLRNRLSGKLMQVDLGSLADNATVEQRGSASHPGSDEWRLVLDHMTHRLVNVRSGKCLSLSQDSAAQNVGLVQVTCSGSALQRFGFAKYFDHYALFSKTGQTLRARDDSTADDVPVVHASADISRHAQQWALEAVSPGALSPDVVADGMYAIVAAQSGKALAVDDAGENGGVAQDTYSASDDRYQWYVARVESNKYNFINRQTGKCLDLESTSASGRLLQRTCSDESTQRFMLTAAGDGGHVIYSLPGNAVEIVGESAQAPAVLGNDTSWTKQRRFLFTPLPAGEPHRLSPAPSLERGPCGEYQSYTLQQPSGAALRAPDEAFVQLMFAGGRRTPDGSEENPYLEQQPGNALVALAAVSYLTGAPRPAGSCAASAVLYDASGSAASACCKKPDGSSGKLTRAAWNESLYLCR